MRMPKKISFNGGFSKGSAFIFVVLLATLLAVVGLMFLMTARFDRFSTSSLVQDKDLDNAAQTVVSDISQQLVLDTPGVLVSIDPNSQEEYYDYPDPCNAWLANLEPYTPDGTNYFWRQISDVYKLLGINSFDLQAEIVPEYENNITPGLRADADGDGVSDSRWIIIPDSNTSTGQPIFASVRMIDNEGVFNVNTDNKFDPFVIDINSNEVDGSSQLQINLIELAKRGNNPDPADTLNLARNPGDESRYSYERGVIWDFNVPPSAYTPFDISDELELRNRYLVNIPDVDSRIENMWANAFKSPNLQTPILWSDSETQRQLDLDDWFYRAQNVVSNPDGDTYSYRHIGTTYNMDRIINPYGGKMINIRNIPETVPATWAQDVLYNALLSPGLDTFQQAQFAQAAANIKDYADGDTEVTTVIDTAGVPHYGYERPDIYISEITIGYTYIDPCDASARYDPNEPNDPNLHRSYAIEVYNNFQCDCDIFSDWQLVIDSPNFDAVIPVTSEILQQRGGRFDVIIYEDLDARIRDLVKWIDSPANGARGVDPCVILRWPDIWGRKARGEWVLADAFDVYFGMNLDDVRDANSSWPVGDIYKGRITEHFFDPFGTDPMELGQTYYWRIAGVNTLDDTIIDSGQPPWYFTTWSEEPNSIQDIIYSTEPPVLTPETILMLQRNVPGSGFINVDVLGPMGAPDDRIMPLWLFDFNDADAQVRTLSFERDLSERGCLRRLWNLAALPDCANPGDFSLPSFPYISNYDSLGHYNNFSWRGPLPQLQSHQRRLNNIGELGFIFKKSTYYMNPVECFDRIQINDTEPEIRLDVTNPYVQNMFKFLTVMDAYNHRSDGIIETRIKGRININTAPWYVLSQLPWVSIRESDIPTYALAKAIVGYRDMTDLSSIGGLDYSLPSNRLGYVYPGFENIGQLNNVVDLTNSQFSIEYFAQDGVDQKGYPDLSVNRRTKDDGHPDDMEERDLIFARISDLVTVRSDVFTAYILVRLGANGPQRRFIAILDRSGVRAPADKVIVRALYPVPDPR